jgi:hypothetical protein
MSLCLDFMPDSGRHSLERIRNAPQTERFAFLQNAGSSRVVRRLAEPGYTLASMSPFTLNRVVSESQHQIVKLGKIILNTTEERLCQTLN